jgi:hypothetical protein
MASRNAHVAVSATGSTGKHWDVGCDLIFSPGSPGCSGSWVGIAMEEDKEENSRGDRLREKGSPRIQGW